MKTKRPDGIDVKVDYDANRAASREAIRAECIAQQAADALSMANLLNAHTRETWFGPMAPRFQFEIAAGRFVG